MRMNYLNTHAVFLFKFRSEMLMFENDADHHDAVLTGEKWMVMITAISENQEEKK